jgi:hypothetical protein
MKQLCATHFFGGCHVLKKIAPGYARKGWEAFDAHLEKYLEDRNPTCPMCVRKFVKIQHNQVYCHFECRNKARLDREKQDRAAFRKMRGGK